MLTVDNISVAESLDGVEVACPAIELTMAESMLCNAAYPLTQASQDSTNSFGAYISRPKEATRRESGMPPATWCC